MLCYSCRGLAENGVSCDPLNHKVEVHFDARSLTLSQRLRLHRFVVAAEYFVTADDPVKLVRLTWLI
ncbi:MAG: hypothetical protein OFPI_03600 [Osedax symbiont Rs2]|nr:MAG: hypothetical protein OFPI_03600 [Osedax symbiont Rs2]